MAYQDFEDLLRNLNDAKARYLIVGAYAVAYYAEPRYTKDLIFRRHGRPRKS